MSKDNIYHEPESLEARLARQRAEREATRKDKPSQATMAAQPPTNTKPWHGIKPRRVLGHNEDIESRDDDDRPIMDRSGRWGKGRDSWGFER